MDMGLRDAKVVVTAGGAGIGLEIVRAFLAEGAQVVTCDVDQSAIAALSTTCPGAQAEVCDVTDTIATAKFVNGAAERMGGLDCLVNNAGIGGPTARVEDVDPADWARCIDVCLTGQFNCTRAAIAHLRKSSNPSIVNMSSAAGHMGFARRTPYAAAKWGVIGFTKSLSIELGEYGIRANAILPGIVEGDRQRRVLEARAQARNMSFEDIREEAFSFASIKEFVTAQQLADQILFLASPRGRMISGQAISVCGDLKMLA